MIPRSALRSLAFAALALGSTPLAAAGNGSNYLHLMNGIDYFFGKTPPAGSLTGIWRCFPSEMLHAPTKAVGPFATTGTLGTYATKVQFIHVEVTVAAGSTIDFPTISLSSSPGDCRFLTSGGALNYSLASVTGFGSIVVGPENAPGGAPPNLLAAVQVLGVPAVAGAGVILHLAISLDPTFSVSAITIPEHESLVLWVQDDPNQFGAADAQYWVGSFDERTLCSGHSFLWSGSSAAIHQLPQLEWAIGLGTLDATLTATMRAAGSGPSGLNAQAGLAVPFDQGSGTRSISITGTSPPNSTAGESLGFAHYDDSHPLSTGPKLVIGSVFGVSVGTPPQAHCHYGSGEVELHPIAGGPVLSTAIPQEPRIPLALDAASYGLLGSHAWLTATRHGTAAGAINIPWFPSPAGGSGATGTTGGAPIPIVPRPALIGVHMGFCAMQTNAAGTAVARTLKAGHSHSNTYDVLFQP